MTSVSQLKRDLKIIQEALTPEVKDTDVAELNELLKAHDRLTSQMTLAEQRAMAKEVAKWATKEGARIREAGGK